MLLSNPRAQLQHPLFCVAQSPRCSLGICSKLYIADGMMTVVATFFLIAVCHCSLHSPASSFTVHHLTDKKPSRHNLRLGIMASLSLSKTPEAVCPVHFLEP